MFQLSSLPHGHVLQALLDGGSVLHDEGPSVVFSRRTGRNGLDLSKITNAICYEVD